MIKYLLEKEFKQMLRNPMLPRMLLVFPCIILLVLPWAANFEIKNINLSVVDNDHSPYSTRLIQKAGASEYFRIVDVSDSYKEAMESIEEGKADRQCGKGDLRAWKDCQHHPRNTAPF